MNAHERGFLAFLAEPTRRRMETLLGLGEKRRRDVREMLDHKLRLDPLFCRRLSGSDAAPAAVAAMLRRHGAPSACRLIAADAALDGREMPLDEALEAVAGSGSGAFLSCLPGRLGFYEYEDPDSSYLLIK